MPPGPAEVLDGGPLHVVENLPANGVGPVPARDDDVGHDAGLLVQVEAEVDPLRGQVRALLGARDAALPARRPGQRGHSGVLRGGHRQLARRAGRVGDCERRNGGWTPGKQPC